MHACKLAECNSYCRVDRIHSGCICIVSTDQEVSFNGVGLIYKFSG